MDPAQKEEIIEKLLEVADYMYRVTTGDLPRSFTLTVDTRIEAAKAFAENVKVLNELNK